MGEVGVLTDQDVQRYVKAGMLSRKAGDTLSTWIKGKPTQATMSEIKQITSVLKDTHGDRLQPIFDQYADNAHQNLGVDLETAYTRLGFPLPKHLKKLKESEGKEENKPSQTEQKEEVKTQSGNVNTKIEQYISNRIKEGKSRESVLFNLKKQGMIDPDYK